MTLGDRPAMPIYPAAMSPLPPSMTVPGRWQPVRVTAAVLCFVAVVLVVASSFLPLYSGELTIETFDAEETLEVTVTPWTVEYSQEELNDSPGNEVPKTGYPMVFVAVALACAAAACWYAATPAAGRTAGRSAGVVTAASSALLIGSAWTTAIVVSTGVDNIIVIGTLNTGLETDASYLAGYWLLLTAILVSFVASVLSLLPARQPAWQPGSPYGSTPPYGVASPMTPRPLPSGPPSHFGPPSHLGAVDPLTGRPVAVVDPLTGLPAMPGAAGPPALQDVPVDPVTGQPVGGPVPQPYAPGAVVDPLTGLPVVPGQVSPPSGLPVVFQPVPPDVGANPVTGEPVVPHQPSPPGGVPVVQPFAQSAAVDPLTGRPLTANPPSPPGGTPALPPLTHAPDAGEAGPGSPVPFTSDPTGQVNGAPSQEAEPPPIVLPDAPPLPGTPPGPAVPATEDPLAEPPRT